MVKPDFIMMWQAFPDHTNYPTLLELHTFIGGSLLRNINEPGFGVNGNTCAVRMSRALNYGNLAISAKLTKALKISTMTGADGKLYIFRVKDLKTYLMYALSKNPIKVSNNFENAFIGQQGIVSFDVSGWSDASGHFALWNGSSFREQHDDYRNLKDNPTTLKIEATTKGMTLWAI